MTLSRLLSVLRARLMIFLAVFGSVVAIAVVLSLVLPKTYIADVAVVINAKGTDPITGAIQPAQFQPGYMATQLDIIASHSVALKVVDSLKLADVPAMRERFQQDNGGNGSLRDWLADKLLKDLDVKPSRESSVVDILFEGSDPRYAAELANAFAAAYVQVGLELSADPARRQSKWFGEQVGNLRAALEKSQDKLAAFQREQHFVAGDERLNVETARLGEISEQLVNAQAATYDASTRVDQMKSAASRHRLQELPDILGNPLLQNMKADLVRAEGHFATVAERYDRNHPEYISAAAEVSTLRARLASEINIAKGSLEKSAQLAQHREQELQDALNRQKAHILAMKQQSDQYAVLTREVDNAQRAYDSAVQRSDQVHLESQLDQSSVAILNPAIPPLHPSKPRLLLNTLLAMVLGSILAAGFALLAELRDRRVRRDVDVMDAIGVPVLAELPLFAKALPAPNNLLIEQG
jgi:chain length determinant protein EpsF